MATLSRSLMTTLYFSDTSGQSHAASASAFCTLDLIVGENLGGLVEYDIALFWLINLFLVLTFYSVDPRPPHDAVAI